MNFFEIPAKAARSLLSNLPLGVQQRLGWRNSATLDHEVTYALNLARHYIQLLAELRLPVRGARILELGPGLDFAPQLALAGLGADVTVADRFLAEWNGAYHGEFYRRFRDRWDGPTAALDAVIAANGYPPEVITRVAEPAESLTAVADRSCDLVVSNAVLEHVYDLPAVCRALARVTRSGGFGVHQIDFRDHWNFARPLEFLVYESAGWQLRMSRGRVGRGNRHRLSDHVNAFQNAGFQIMQVDTNMKADQAYLDDFLPRLRASRSPYRDRGVEDLAALSARITVARS